MKAKIFISYRRDGGSELAGRVRDRLQHKGYIVFLDVEDLRSGPFNTALFAEIETSTDVVVILSPNSLDRCSDESDWLRLEVAHAIREKKNIIPVMTRGFKWPTQPLPDDITDLQNHHGLEPSHDYFDASMDKLCKLLVGQTGIYAKFKNRKSLFRMVIALILVIGITIGGNIYLSGRSSLKERISEEKSRSKVNLMNTEKESKKNDNGKPSDSGLGKKVFTSNYLKKGYNDTTQTKKSFVDPFSGIELIFVKGGCFEMGDIFGDGHVYERPVHEACVDDFYIGKYEITQGQWKKVMGSNPSKFIDCGDNCPVEKVSWLDAQEFIKRLNSNSGLKSQPYRLPTEAEWEYAARSGGKKEKFAGSNEIEIVAWYYSNSEGKTHPVGQKKPNGLGIYDMSGNVGEWVADYHDKYSSEHQKNPKGPVTGTHRGVRGGWIYQTDYARTVARLGEKQGVRYSDFGFRIAR